jgi:hypothetical protein
LKSRFSQSVQGLLSPRTTLGSILRRSDVVTRERSVFWVLLPDCNRDPVGDRPGGIVKKVDDFGLDSVNCDGKAQTAWRRPPRVVALLSNRPHSNGLAGGKLLA